MSDSSSPAPDNSLAVAQFNAKQAADQKIQDKADADTAAANLAGLRTSSADSARNQTSQYLTSLGLDPTQYQPSIDSSINNILMGINSADPNPGSYFKTAPQDIYGDLTRTNQQQAQKQIDSLYSPDYATTKIGQTMDDPILSQIYGSQRSDADAIIQNMLKRGVITNTGAAGAEADLDRQSSGVKTKLNTIGDQVLSGGQQKLNDIINGAKTTAGTLTLGQQFDPSSYSKNTDQAFNDFVNSLGDSIKSNVNGNLFQTNGLAAIAGAAQGAGNTAYDPKAAAGVISDPTTDDPTAPAKQSENIF